MLEKTQNQIIHNEYGGVFPEIAAREHLKAIQYIWQDIKNTIDISRIGYIAVTTHPGLIGSLLVGLSFAKGLSISLNAELIPINHLEGHMFSVKIENNPSFPALFCLFSGGHTQIIYAQDWFDYQIVAQTTDDSIGEGFDKVAKMMSLGYPGGPIIEQKATNGLSDAFHFTIPMINSVDFSISGLKTQVLRTIQKIEHLDNTTVCNIAASFQKTISDMIISKLNKITQSYKTLSLVGGVSANQYIRKNLLKFCDNKNVQFLSPSLKHSTDNATMIAFVGLEKIKRNCL